MATSTQRKARTTKQAPKVPSEPTVTKLRSGSCKSLEGGSTLYYEFGTDPSGDIYWRITRNDGGGFFNKKWVPVPSIRAALEQWSTDKPITSSAFRPLYRGKSVNNSSFLLAALLAEGVVTLMPGKRRHFALGNLKALPVTDVDSDSGKPSGKASGKTGDRMAAGSQKAP